MDAKILNSIKSVYFRKTISDHFERLYKYTKEKLFGVDYSVFDKTIRYYKETKGQTISHNEALTRALDKKKHKDAWFMRERIKIDDFMQFYQEVDVYPFRQPYLKRFGGFRWYIHLVNHVVKPRILEYGCGSAVLSEYLIEKFSFFHYTVADIPSVTLEFVKWKKITYQYAYEILTIGPGREGIPLRDKYDLIICRDVLEHTPNPLDIVNAFISKLSPGGVLITDFINSPGGENLEVAVEQRETVKNILKKKLIALKAIDEPTGNDGLYIKDA
ncbi:MAG: class I SAM-dependent methyltransferase [Nitrospirae bacterium]|nr:class I SAM-dependent methyltransferase [Nitrospirota bacterium]